MDFTSNSLVHWFDEKEGHKCGYCKCPLGSISYGMWATELTVEDYQELIDRGWRRSGKYCYKPIMDKTCCPQYTIKCDAVKFQLSKSHKKVIKKFNKFVADGTINNTDIPCEEQNSDTAQEIPVFPTKEHNTNFNKQQIKLNSPETNQCEEMAAGEPRAHSTNIKSGKCDIPINESDKSVDSATNIAESKASCSFKAGVGMDSGKPPCKKAKLLRLERKKEKMVQRGMHFEPSKQGVKQKSLKEFLEDIPDTAKHKLQLKLISTDKIESSETTRNVELELYKKYQKNVHDDRCVTMSSFLRFLVVSPLKITLHSMSRDHPFFKTSFDLYKKYQMAVHGDTEEDCELEQFEDFLVMTPLKRKPFPNDPSGPGYGSFHQQYWIDDKLIAVGVIDILPKCISSVYFFYDPDYRSLTLGTYGSIREIYFVRSLQERVPDLANYYMGFYIHSCPKMRYKGKLQPSYLACPETYEWVPIEKCIPKLEASKYSRLTENSHAVDKSQCSPGDLEKLKIVDSHILYNYKNYMRHNKDLKPQFDLIGKLIGKKCVPSMIFL